MSATDWAGRLERDWNEERTRRQKAEDRIRRARVMVAQFVEGNGDQEHSCEGEGDPDCVACWVHDVDRIGVVLDGGDA